MQSQDTVLIPLRAKDGSVRAHAIVDATDASMVNRRRWCLGSHGYAYRMTSVGGHPRVLLLHRFLLGLAWGDDRYGDHINRNKMDNRRINLRCVTRQGNSQNRRSLGGTSTYRGVSWDKGMKKWLAKVEVSKQVFRLGYFSDEQEAAEAARSARLQLMPFSPD